MRFLEMKFVCVFAVSLATRMSQMPTNSTSGSRTTVSLGRTASLALPSCSSETLWSKARARAGAPWDAAFTWTTRVSPSCESCPSAPMTKWPKNLSSSNQNAGTQTRWWHSSHDRNHWSVFLQGKKRTEQKHYQNVCSVKMMLRDGWKLNRRRFGISAGMNVWSLLQRLSAKEQVGGCEEGKK